MIAVGFCKAKTLTTETMIWFGIDPGFFNLNFCVPEVVDVINVFVITIRFLIDEEELERFFGGTLENIKYKFKA